MKAVFDKVSSPVGDLYLVSDGEYINAIIFGKHWAKFKSTRALSRDQKDSAILNAKKQLAEYFSGKRKKFEVRCKPEGTVFQLKSWQALKQIKFGTTKSYKDQAKLIKNEKAVRAIGSANGKNPICIIYPCHRVIGSKGNLSGFAGGLRAKKYLLELEGVKIA